MSATTTKIDAEQEFTRFWGEKGRVASTMMAEFGRVIVLVRGKTDRVGREKGVIVLSAYGLQKAGLINGQLASGACLTPAQAIAAFNRSTHERDFMDVVKAGYDNLFR